MEMPQIAFVVSHIQSIYDNSLDDDSELPPQISAIHIKLLKTHNR